MADYLILNVSKRSKCRHKKSGTVKIILHGICCCRGISHTKPPHTFGGLISCNITINSPFLSISRHIKQEPITVFFTCYRLCVFASGSLIIKVLNCWTFTNVSFLHFGQNNRKFVIVVSCRSLIRVLFSQTGHNSQSIFSAISTTPLIFHRFYHCTVVSLLIDSIKRTLKDIWYQPLRRSLVCDITITKNFN